MWTATHEPAEQAPLAGPHTFVWSPGELADIYREGVNLCVWRRGLDARLSGWLSRVTQEHDVELVTRVRGGSLDLSGVPRGVPRDEMFEAWREDLEFLLRLYSDLLGAEEFGVRLTTLTRDMCPRFHVDRVGVRLLCTYAGPATEWLENLHVVRGALGASGTGEVPRPGAPVQSLERFDVALLKGEAWPGNAGNGVVHRSPAIAKDGVRRLLLSIDAL
jgi:hypothetical protein